MEIIPFITLRNRKIINSTISLDKLSQYTKEEEKLYVLDLDGVEKDKPNLCTFQKISSKYQLWIDCGPRALGDVVDIFMTGAESVTLRKTLFSSLNISDIREISENKVYLKIDYQNYKKDNIYNSFFKEYDGFVSFNNKEEIEQDFKFEEFLNKIQMQNKIYFYEKEIRNRNFWEKIGATGLIVDIDKLKEFKNGF
jgi:hypothetical protein